MVKKILNLFAGLGGNRMLWDELGEFEITAVELHYRVANIYKKYFPNDKMIIGDAIEFVQTNDIEEYDFIWASPSCLTHTMLQMVRGYNVPDMTSLYGLITYFDFRLKDSKTKWLVENVKPWYTPLIKPKFFFGRHYFWGNCYVVEKDLGLDYKKYDKVIRSTIKQLCKYHGLDRKDFDNSLEDRQLVRNCVHRKMGREILKQVLNSQELAKFL
jgi:DNA (cytosine-5)-methyltransferase 1